jgi:hypothetical protein
MKHGSQDDDSEFPDPTSHKPPTSLELLAAPGNICYSVGVDIGGGWWSGPPALAWPGETRNLRTELDPRLLGASRSSTVFALGQLLSPTSEFLGDEHDPRCNEPAQKSK